MRWPRRLPPGVLRLVSPIAAADDRTTSRFGALLDPAQLPTPVPPVRTRPVMQGPDRLGVRSVEHPAAIAARSHEAHLAPNPPMLRAGWLGQPHRGHDIAHRALG